MIFEKLNFQIDIQKLQDHFSKYILPLPTVGGATMFGGWSVLSSDGSYKDGWHRGHMEPSEDNKNLSPDERRALYLSINKNSKLSRDYNVATEICHSYMQEVIDRISDAKLFPSRARIIRLSPNTVSFKHRDETDLAYAVRLHIPIFTNENCFFETEHDGRAHLAADGSLYLIHVNRIHWVSNHGQTNRYHLVIDVRDMTGVTQFHTYDPIKYPESLDLKNRLPNKPVVQHNHVSLQF